MSSDGAGRPFGAGEGGCAREAVDKSGKENILSGIMRNYANNLIERVGVKLRGRLWRSL